MKDKQSGGRLSRLARKAKKLLWFCLNPRLLLCIAIAWFITNGWCYLFLLLGGLLHIPWMTAAGGAWAMLLWLPFTPEKILTLFLAILLLRFLFPKDEKTLQVLKGELARIKTKLRSRRDKRGVQKNEKEKDTDATE